MFDFPQFDGNAACAETDPDAFFPESGGEGQALTRQARKVCNNCEIRNPCLQWALDNDEAGTWGGLTERQRQRLTANRPRPRPARELPLINHGTEAGRRAHNRRGEKACGPCLSAAAAAKQERRAS